MNCKDATALSIKREEQRLTLKERVAYWLHLTMCKYCRWFDQQNKVLNEWLASNSEINATLSNEERKEIIEKLNNVK